MNDLVSKMNTIAEEQDVQKITRAKVWLGALSHISADHFREHFVEGTRGTVAEGAELEVEISDDTENSRAQDILLLSVDVEEN